MPRSENADEIDAFIVEGTHRLAVISMNDYGFLLSARMAQSYLARALHVLEARKGLDRAFLNEVGLLKAAGSAIAREYAQFEKFCRDSERFDHLQTRNWHECLSRWVVLAVSSAYRGTVSHHLAYKTRAFHSRVCAILTEKIQH